jgi:hypothetical protein
MAIYRADATAPPNYPSTLVATSVEVALGPGNTEPAPSSSVALAAGDYWIMANFSANATIQGAYSGDAIYVGEPYGSAGVPPSPFPPGGASVDQTYPFYIVTQD